MTPVVTWNELLKGVFARVREPDAMNAQNGSTGETGLPYYSLEVVERWLYMAALLQLRLVPLSRLETIKSGAIDSGILANGDVIPLNHVKVLGAAIQVELTGPFVAAEQVDHAGWYQMITVPSDVAAIYTFFSRSVNFKGHRIRLTTLVEPPIEYFQNDLPILPEACAEDMIDFVHGLMLSEDFMPAGRM